jgi:carboxymethylenebutenolidase
MNRLDGRARDEIHAILARRIRRGLRLWQNARGRKSGSAEKETTVIERHADIPTPDGTMRTFLCHPERDGPHPVVILLMDAPGIRGELRDMVRRLASVGYYVMLPNLYYRAGVEEIFKGPNPLTTDQMFELMNQTTIARVMVDVDTLLAFAAIDPAASDGPVGVVGYCMSGQHAINAAARHPDRIAAAASFYGTRLVTDKPDSPHRVVGKAKAELYLGCAEHDEYAPLEMVAEMRAALEKAGAKAEVEIYEGAGHGFAFPKRSTFDRAAAERHWERLFALFGRALR